MPPDEGRRESRKIYLCLLYNKPASLRYYSSMLYNGEQTIRVGKGENIKGAIPCFNGF
jgi:hypothetical protein